MSPSATGENLSSCCQVSCQFGYGFNSNIWCNCTFLSLHHQVSCWSSHGFSSTFGAIIHVNYNLLDYTN